MVAPRPTSNNSRSFPASTSVAAPNRSVVGNGVPVPSSVTLKSCAQAAYVKARQADTITKRRTMPIPRLHGCAGRASLSGNGLDRKAARRDRRKRARRGRVRRGGGERCAQRRPRDVGLGVWLSSQSGGRRRLRRAVLYSFRRLRIAFEAMPLPPHARSLPRHLPPARCFAQALWFDLQTPGLAD